MVTPLINCRYANMDFILFKSLIGSNNELLVFSYDIACQWSRNLSQHQGQLPNSMWLLDQQLCCFTLPFPNFTFHSMVLFPKPTFHSTTTLIYPLQMLKTLNT